MGANPGIGELDRGIPRQREFPTILTDQSPCMDATRDWQTRQGLVLKGGGSIRCDEPDGVAMAGRRGAATTTGGGRGNGYQPRAGPWRCS